MKRSYLSSHTYFKNVSSLNFLFFFAINIFYTKILNGTWRNIRDVSKGVCDYKGRRRSLKINGSFECSNKISAFIIDRSHKINYWEYISIFILTESFVICVEIICNSINVILIIHKIFLKFRHHSIVHLRIHLWHQNVHFFVYDLISLKPEQDSKKYIDLLNDSNLTFLVAYDGMRNRLSKNGKITGHKVFFHFKLKNLGSFELFFCGFLVI